MPGKEELPELSFLSKPPSFTGFGACRVVCYHHRSLLSICGCPAESLLHLTSVEAQEPFPTLAPTAPPKSSVAVPAVQSSPLTGAVRAGVCPSWSDSTERASLCRPNHSRAKCADPSAKKCLVMDADDEAVLNLIAECEWDLSNPPRSTSSSQKEQEDDFHSSQGTLQLHPKAQRVQLALGTIGLF